MSIFFSYYCTFLLGANAMLFTLSAVAGRTESMIIGVFNCFMAALLFMVGAGMRRGRTP